MPQSPPGYRLPSQLNLGPVTLQVADLGRSIAYYEQILGLRAETPTSGTAALAAGDGRTLVGRPLFKMKIEAERLGHAHNVEFAKLLDAAAKKLRKKTPALEAK